MQLGCDGPLTRPWLHAVALRACCVDHGLPFQDALDARINLPTAKQDEQTKQHYCFEDDKEQNKPSEP